MPRLTTITLFAQLLLASSASADIVNTEEVPLGISECANGATDDLSIQVSKVFVQKQSGFLTSDSEAVVSVTAKITGKKKNAKREPFESTVPLVFKSNLQEYQSDIVGLGTQELIVGRLPLNSNDVAIDAITLTVDVYIKKKSTQLGSFVSGVLDITESTLLPTLGLSAAGSTVGNLLVKTVKQDLTANDQQRPLLNGSFVLQVDPAGKCASNTTDFAGRGTHALVNRTSKLAYCFKDLRDGASAPSSEHRLMAIARNSDGSCPGTNAKGWGYWSTPYVLLSAEVFPLDPRFAAFQTSSLAVPTSNKAKDAITLGEKASRALSSQRENLSTTSWVAYDGTDGATSSDGQKTIRKALATNNEASGLLQQMQSTLESIADPTPVRPYSTLYLKGQMTHNERLALMRSGSMADWMDVYDVQDIQDALSAERIQRINSTRADYCKSLQSTQGFCAKN